MNDNQASRVSPVQYIYEAAFSLNLALVTIGLVFVFGPYPIILSLNRLEFLINEVLQIKQTDLIRGYWEFFLPGLALAICIWVLLRLSSRAKLTRWVLRSVGGVAALSAVPAYWLCVKYSESRRYGWDPFHAPQLYEVVLVLGCASMYLLGKRPIVWWGNLLILLHCGFWLWQFWPQFLTLLTGYGGSAAVTCVVGFGASVAWVLYARQPAYGRNLA